MLVGSMVRSQSVLLFNNPTKIQAQKVVNLTTYPKVTSPLSEKIILTTVDDPYNWTRGSKV